MVQTLRKKDIHILETIRNRLIPDTNSFGWVLTTKSCWQKINFLKNFFFWFVSIDNWITLGFYQFSIDLNHLLERYRHFTTYLLIGYLIEGCQPMKKISFDRQLNGLQHTTFGCQILSVFFLKNSKKTPKTFFDFIFPEVH